MHASLMLVMALGAAGAEKALEARVSVSFISTPFLRCVEELQDKTGTPFVIERKQLAGAVLRHPVTLKLARTRAREILDWLVKYVGAGYELDGSVVLVTSYAAAVRRRAVLRRYDVRDITWSYVDFPGPSFELMFGGPQQASHPMIITGESPGELTASSIAELVQARVAADSWAAELGTSIEERRGSLYVMQTPETHAGIDRFLAELRSKVKRLVEVELVMLRFDPPREEPIARLLDGTAAEELRKQGELVFRSSTVSLDNRRHHILAGEQTRYVADIEVSGDMHDPCVRELLGGFSVDVLPVSARGGKTVTLDLRFKWTELTALPEKEIGKLSLKGEKGSAKLQVPQLEIRGTSTSVCIPKGSWAVVELPPERRGIVMVRSAVVEGE